MEAETKNPLYGRPWKNVARFVTFEEADKARKKYLKEENLQAKVKKMQNNYVVKTRVTLVERKKGKRKDKNFYKRTGGLKNDS